MEPPQDVPSTAAAEPGDQGAPGVDKVKYISMAEVAKHCTETDCWLAIYGKVYDVTKFMDDHPGGGDVMLNATGRDATDDFEDIGHSSDARKMLEDFFIADLDPADAPKRVVPEKRDSTSRKSSSETSIFMIFLQILVPIAIIGLAIAVRFLTAPQEPEGAT